MRIAIAVCLLTVTLFAAPARAEVTVWAGPAENKVERFAERIGRGSHVWSPEENTIRLAGAGGEHVPFQVIVSVVRDTLRQVTFDWSELTSGGAVFSAENVERFYSPAVKVYTPSTEHGMEGWFPDPLAPLSGPLDVLPERRRERENATFWMDVVIPRGQAAGTYEGSLRVRSAAGVEKEFTVVLEVYDFSLPESFHQFAMFNCSRGWLGSYYNERRLDGESLDNMLVRYFDFMLERGIQPWFNPLLQPEWKDLGDRLELSWPNREWEEHFLSHPAYQRVTFPAAPGRLEHASEHEKFTPAFNRKVRDWVGAIYEHYREHGWEDKLTFFGPVDEPRTLAEYEELLRWGELVHSVEPSLSFQVTEQPLPQEPSWPSLAREATDWVIHGSQLERNREEIVKRLEEGDHACWYISCDQTYPMANYFIDAGGAEVRAVAWITERYGLQGMLYWAVNFWREVRSPWTDAVTWKRSSCNAPLSGEGSLLYPGEGIEDYCGLADVTGPVSSIRFELLRRGMQDIEYLFLLKEMGLEREAARLCAELVISQRAFSRDPSRYDRIKAEAAGLIQGGR